MRNEVRTMLIQVAGGLALIGTLLISYQSAEANREALEGTARNNDAQLRLEQFSNASARLADPSATVRIGAVQELAALADADESRTESVARVLSGFVSERSPWPPPTKARFGEKADYADVPYMDFRVPDVNAALRALGRGALGQGTTTVLNGRLEAREPSGRKLQFGRHPQRPHGGIGTGEGRPSKRVFLRRPSGRSRSHRGQAVWSRSRSQCRGGWRHPVGGRRHRR